MNGRMGTRYEDVLAARSAAMALPTELHGASGYFSRPTHNLDPRLFPTGAKHWEIRPDVRRYLLHTLYAYWQRKFHRPHDWSTVWIAGSGITHQWSGGRSTGEEPGDLDVLVGVNWPEFFAANPIWQGFSPDAMAEQMNEALHAELWARTANVVLPSGGAPFEVTFYVNPNGTDIRTIHPYAAYNLTDNQWTVHPVELPGDWDPTTHFPQQWWDQVNREATHATELLAAFRSQQERARTQTEDSGAWLNTMTAMHDTLRQAGGLYDAIHTERRRAFGPDGAGYGDYYNFRWQAHKHLGTAQALHQLAALDADAHRDVVQRCYPGQTLSSSHAIVLAARAVNGNR